MKSPDQKHSQLIRNATDRITKMEQRIEVVHYKSAMLNSLLICTHVTVVRVFLIKQPWCAQEIKDIFTVTMIFFVLLSTYYFSRLLTESRKGTK